MSGVVVIPDAERARIAREARQAYPAECCGLVEGTWTDSTALVTAIHPTPNIATDNDRFEIDPARHIALLRGLRGSGRGIIGCYHSHPDGRAFPSPRDGDGASQAGFLWLIHGAPDLRGFIWTGAAFMEIALAARAVA